jgi:hypothetical protein
MTVSPDMNGRVKFGSRALTQVKAIAFILALSNRCMALNA